MVRYYKLFDLLNRRGMKKTDLREILSSKTIAKLSKGEYLSGEVIEKICLYLECQPGDIMEIVEVEKLDGNDSLFLTHKSKLQNGCEDISINETYLESIPKGLKIKESDEIGLTSRQIIDSDNI